MLDRVQEELVTVGAKSPQEFVHETLQVGHPVRDVAELRPTSC